MRSFNVNLLSERTKDLAQPWVAVLIVESIGLNFGKLLTNSVWIFTKPYITPDWKPLRESSLYKLADKEFWTLMKTYRPMVNIIFSFPGFMSIFQDLFVSDNTFLIGVI